MNISDQEKFVVSSTSAPKPFTTGIILEKSNLSPPKVEDIDIQNKKLCPFYQPLLKIKKKYDPHSATVESQPLHKKKTYKDKLSSSELITQTTLLSKTLDQVLTSKEKAFKPFWTTQSKEISMKLWLPTRTDSVVSVLTSSKKSSLPRPMGKSWFSIKETPLPKMNSSMTSFQLSQFSLPECTVSEVTPSKTKSKKPSPNHLKTLKGRFLPTEEEKEKLQLMMKQSHWYYNAILSCFVSAFPSKEAILKRKSFSDYQIRDLLTQYEFIEKEDEDNYIQFFQLKDEPNTIQFHPSWWPKAHTRLPRGVAKKFTQNINSIISNYRNGHIKDFELHFRSQKKTKINFVLFEDKGFPAFIRNIKSQYWYTDVNGKKKRSSFSDLCSQTKERGLEITYDKKQDKYYFSYPVEHNFYPPEDRRNENQVKLISDGGERIIAIDPGVRKFGVGYDPNGKIVLFGQGANKEILSLLYEIDKEKGDTSRLWKKVKDMINELHWKTISYLMMNYDHIMIPDFKISGMVKHKKISRETKRMLYMFSYHNFMSKLKYKCLSNNKKLYIVDESFTSKTCCQCGTLNNVEGNEIYKCEGCHMTIDRDVNGSMNIFIKNTQLI